MVPSGEMGPILLPGQKAVQEGKMQEAIMNFIGGALLACVLFSLTYPFYSYFIHFETLLKKLILPFLIFTITFTIAKSKNSLKALILFIISGLYGVWMLNSGIDGNVLLGAHFTAMFGLAGLLVSERIPKQEINKTKISLNFPQAFSGFIGGILISLFPAITPAQAYVIILLMFGNSAKGLTAAGSLTLSSFLFSFQSLLFFGKGRMAIVEAIGFFDFSSVVFYALLAFFIVLIFCRYFIKFINQIPKLKEIAVLLIFISLILFYPEALPFACFSLILGLSAYHFNIERVHLTGSLLLPTILWYLKL